VSLEFVGGNRIDLLAAGVEYFPALEAAIAAAEREIFLEAYIYADDATGRRITVALAAAARRGVAVQVLVDGFGSRHMPQLLRQALRDAGARLQIYGPDISPLTLRRQRLRRMHRKLAAVDGRIAFVGGINVVDDLDADSPAHPRYDYAVRIEGPLAAEVRMVTARLWKRVAWVHVNESAMRLSVRPPAPVPCGELAAALALRDNFRHRADIEDAYLGAIESAREEILLANAYFLPGRRFRRALVDAAGRGVRVVLLLQGRADHPLQHYASQALYGTLLDAGVEIYEYHKSMLHAKVAVIDHRWVTVGSSNIDPFSLLLSREANVVIEDRRFAAALRLSLHLGMEEGAVMVPPARWRQQPWTRRARIWIAYALVRLMMGLAGYGRPH
jgi:cardiolipin synthase